jgi:hypothetical protein
VNKMPLHEIHLTVYGTNGTNDVKDVEHFINVCGMLGLKPLTLDLQFYKSVAPDRSLLVTNELTTISQMMTSSRLEGSLIDISAYVAEIVNKLTSFGFHVARRKVEVSMDEVFDTDYIMDDRPVYAEVHQKITVMDNIVGVPALWERLQKEIKTKFPKIAFSGVGNEYTVVQPYLSKNSLADTDGKSRFVTWRKVNNMKQGYRYPVQISGAIDLFQEFLKTGFGNAIQPGLIKKELVMIDTNKGLDSHWSPL